MVMSKSVFTALLIVLNGLAFAQGNVETIDTVEGDDGRAEAERTPLQTVIPEYPRRAWLDQFYCNS